MTADWSSDENETTLTEYFSMLEQELAGQSYVKARHNERVRSLTGRSRGAVEFKFQNISAALQALRAPWIEGYKPARNYQNSLPDAVQRFLTARPALTELMRQNLERVAAPRVDFAWNLIAPPTDVTFSKRAAPVHHIDFAKLEASNRTLGMAGEKLILARERDLLSTWGRPDLAHRVEHVSVTQGDGLGFDISSFNADGSPRLIEVKTTRRGEVWPMFVTRNELAVSRRESTRFVLARVFDFAAPRIGLFELPGAIEDTCLLEPESWRALPRSA